MSDNPFDVFAADFKAAIPTVEASNENQNDQPINIMAQPAAAPVPVMRAPAAPVMNSAAPAMGGMPMNGGGMPMYGAAPVGGGQPGYNQGGFGGAMVPSAQPTNPYAMNMGVPPPAAAGMYGQQPPPQMAPQMGQMGGMFGAAPPAAPPAAPGYPPSAPAGGMPMTGGPSPPAPMPAEVAPVPPPVAPVPPTPVSADPFGAAPPTPLPSGGDPFGAAPPVPQPQPPSADPFGGEFGAAPQPGNDAIVPVPNGAINDDPFGVFGAPPTSTANSTAPSHTTDALSVASPVPQNQFTQEQIAMAADGGDPWAAMGFGDAAPAPAPIASGGGLLGDEGALVPAPASSGIDDDRKSGELPPGGEWYDARIFTPTLGVMFFKPQELTDSLFLQTERTLVDALDDRPVVAFIVEGSSARAAGVELGHVLLKVNGIDVKNPKEASRLIKEGPRPLPLLFYVPDTTVVVAEGEHMVKYDTRETMAPNSAKDWKPKYVVIGGIIAQPWMMNMYRSKSEYDIAVIETQARRPVSVKVKQFSLQGARVQNDWQGPQMVKYKNKLHPWKYIVVLPISRNPIKISSPNLGQLKPVHEGIRRVLMAQQRYAPNAASPARDPYGGQQGSGQHHQGYGGSHPGHQQQGYSGGGPSAGGGGGYSQGPPDQGYGQPQQQSQPAYGAPPPQQSPPEYGYAPSGGDQYSTSGGMAGNRRKTAYEY